MPQSERYDDLVLGSGQGAALVVDRLAASWLPGNDQPELDDIPECRMWVKALVRQEIPSVVPGVLKGYLTLRSMTRLRAKRRL